MVDTAPLFAPLQVGPKIFRNRTVIPPMVVMRGITTPEGIEWYGRRALGGVGLVIVEATGVTGFGIAYTAENLRPLVDTIHAGGYRIAAEICAQAEFDGVEPHGAHGFLLNRFFSPAQNQRTDLYGGDLAGRARLGLRIVETIRPMISEAGMLLLYRHTPVGPGYDITDSLFLAQALVDAGVDILDISPASHAVPGDRAAPFMQLGVPVIAVNELDRVERAVEVLRENRATLAAVGRGLIADPDWPQKVRDGRLDEIVTCMRCDDCHTDLDNRVTVRCSEWD
jgi:2,4-dienoyl-CoA reductase-like NADH-dependent reductase (Old Yellow Enzyme family)